MPKPPLKHLSFGLCLTFELWNLNLFASLRYLYLNRAVGRVSIWPRQNPLALLEQLCYNVAMKKSQHDTVSLKGIESAITVIGAKIEWCFSIVPPIPAGRNEAGQAQIALQDKTRLFTLKPHRRTNRNCQARMSRQDESSLFYSLFSRVV